MRLQKLGNFFAGLQAVSHFISILFLICLNIYLAHAGLDANTMGQISGLAGISYGGALQVMACASIGSGLKFVPTPAQTLYVLPQRLLLHFPITDSWAFSGIFAALLVFQGSVASCGTRIIARLQNVIITMNLVYAFISMLLSCSDLITISFRIAVVLIAAVAAATPPNFRNTAAFAFGTFKNCMYFYQIIPDSQLKHKQ